jgi:hypothetical protein
MLDFLEQIVEQDVLEGRGGALAILTGRFEFLSGPGDRPIERDRLVLSRRAVHPANYCAVAGAAALWFPEDGTAGFCLPAGGTAVF